MRRWRVMKWEFEPERQQEIVFDCPDCGGPARLPISHRSRVTAQCQGGMLIADTKHEPGDSPQEIECPHCRRRFSNEEEEF